MAQIKFANNVSTQLTKPITKDSSTLEVRSLTLGLTWPELTSPGDYFLIVIDDIDRSRWEILKCTNVEVRSNETILTVERGLENTVASDFNAGALVENRLTAGTINNFATGLPDIVPITRGGTGASTPAEARKNLEIYSKDEVDAKDTVLAEQIKASMPPDATTAVKGIVQLSNAIDSDSEILAATSKAVHLVNESAVHKQGSEDISGAKTFLATPIVKADNPAILLSNTKSANNKSSVKAVSASDTNVGSLDFTLKSSGDTAVALVATLNQSEEDKTPTTLGVVRSASGDNFAYCTTPKDSAEGEEIINADWARRNLSQAAPEVAQVIYINGNSGDDANDGSVNKPLKTIYEALKRLRKYVPFTHAQLILQEGNFAGLEVDFEKDYKSLIITGQNSVTIEWIIAVRPGVLQLENISITGVNQWNQCITSNTGVVLNLLNVTITAPQDSWAIVSSDNGLVNIMGYCNIVCNNSAGAIAAVRHGLVMAYDATITINGTVSVSSVAAWSVSVIEIGNSTTITGIVTGPRYQVTTNSVINTSGGGANRFPGTINGTTDSGGIYY